MEGWRGGEELEWRDGGREKEMSDVGLGKVGRIVR